MATARNILKNWFKTGLKPTEQQFAALIDSFRHLTEDTIAISNVQNLSNVLAGKASTAQISNVLTVLGNLEALETIDKTSLVAAINEIKALVGEGGGASSFEELEGNPNDNPAMAAALALKADLPNERISGGESSVPVAGTIRIAPASWRLLPDVYETFDDTDFPDIENSSLGQQRYIAFFGNTSNIIIKVEGLEGSIATMPNQPENTILINAVIVNDAGIGQGQQDLSGLATKQELGDLNNLTTSDKSSAVNAINEVSNDVLSLSQDQITLSIFKVSNYATI